MKILDDTARAELRAQVLDQIPAGMHRRELLADTVIESAELRVTERIVSRVLAPGRPWITAAVDQLLAGDHARVNTHLRWVQGCVPSSRERSPASSEAGDD